MKNLHTYLNEARKAKEYIIPEYIHAGPELSKDINLIKAIDKIFFKMSAFNMWDLDEKNIKNSGLNVEVDPDKRILYFNNVTEVWCNIASGLDKYSSLHPIDFYEIMLPEGSVLIVRDSASKSRYLDEFKDAILNVFSKDNKFEAISLYYITLSNCSLDKDFLSDIYTNNLQFNNANGIRTIKSDSSKFANPNCKIDAAGKKTFAATVDKAQQQSNMKKQQEEAKNELEKSTRSIAEKVFMGVLDDNEDNFRGSKEDKEKFIDYITKALIKDGIKSFDQLDGPYYSTEVKDTSQKDGPWEPFKSSPFDLVDYNSYDFTKSYDDYTVWRNSPDFTTKVDNLEIYTHILHSYRTIGIGFCVGELDSEYTEMMGFWYEYTYDGKKLKKPNYREIW